MQDVEITISTPSIKLGQYLKLAGLAETGGHAKELIAAGEVTVNDEVVTARGHTLHPGDTVRTPAGSTLIVFEEEDDEDFDPEKWKDL